MRFASLYPAGVLALVSVLLVPSAPVGQATITFDLVQVDNARWAHEPVIDIGGDGQLWYAGMNASDGDDWHAPSDSPTPGPGSSPFTSINPTVTGGTDAMVHHGVNDLIFFAEQSPLQTVAYDGQNFLQVRTRGVDRPWMQTVGGTTYEEFNDGSSRSNKVEVWTYVPSSDDWTPLNGPDNPAYTGTLGETDFASEPNGSLHILLTDRSQSPIQLVSRWGGSGSTWSSTQEFQRRTDDSFGLPRVRVDGGGAILVVDGEVLNSQFGMFLHVNHGGSGWDSPVQLSAVGTTAALPALVAGSAGRFGVAWYETDGGFFPAGAPAGTTWRYVYRLFAQTNGTYQAVQNVTLLDSAWQGPINGSNSSFAGDFTSLIERQGLDAGKVDLAFAGMIGPPVPVGSCGALVCPPPPLPLYAWQNAGDGIR